ncbi:FAD-dependent oxidoreductase [Tuwongella immobilis]|uniref:BFD-like [2Fe-2S]-binding domain-containing protein n=1 Tax=Tuwongella immobilis TaxID=692036 RepID=A0A6C2YIL5_9BACT|nr:FAD-dependent oxidoreductase [Tuwongella immobilis]VIP00983.1 nitrite reductase : Nitrite reductase (NAD(P)H) OS=Sorangium cellulosum (strain So ce56) GN=nasD PE=4 SV=1: Pyr_redox_2: Pyr_redox: Fer2_BFD [Tuwongella immobilis]VTR97384.1 nitrite reductase : Nitrite reductase (NAD(P)H) OS=Sorangium cellulosum (strain So ce56) GN=nasD PE=4 SV=1: Pyr_redox_2: Pyr_redox: Fer2_BFD [Tuwongella immobilis]
MIRETLAIIGNGMATGRLLDDLLRRDALKRYEIIVFGEEPHGCYNRILLNRVLLGGSTDEITLKPASWYAERGIRLITGDPVVAVSPAAQRLWTQSGGEFFFHRVIFATGSVARLLPVDGITAPNGRWKDGLAVYRTVADCQRIREVALRSKHAVVVGGGLLGLEAAKALADLGLQVTLLHLFDTLMNRQLDRVGSAMLRRAIERMGIRVMTSANTQAILGTQRVEGVLLTNGERIAAELVVVASGIKARIELAKDADIPTNAGILVNDRLESSVPRVYAVGECAEHAGKVYGIVQPLYEQCAVLAAVLMDAESAAYRGSKVYTRLKIVGMDVASMGDIEPQTDQDEVVQIIEERRGIYRKLIIRENRLVGAVLVGDTSLAAALVRRYERADPLPANRLDLFASDDRIGESTAERMICNCHQVSESAIVEAVRGGCRTLPELVTRTGAGTGCGSCQGQLAAVLRQCGSARLSSPAPVVSAFSIESTPHSCEKIHD